MQERSIDLVGFGRCLGASSETAGFVVPLVRREGVDELNGEEYGAQVVNRCHLLVVGSSGT